MAHLDEYKLLSDRRHAFRKGTVVKLSRLSTVINEWAKILDDGGQVDTLKKTQFSFLLSEDQIYFDFPNLTDQQRKNQKTS